MATDYWLSKLMFDLQDPKLREAYRADRASVLANYKLEPVVRRALETHDIEVLAPRVNAYLLRFYYQYSGIRDADFIAGLRGLAANKIDG
jgi:Aromatic-ring-opening dioxygenase LigAB, LigA subunit